MEREHLVTALANFSGAAEVREVTGQAWESSAPSRSSVPQPESCSEPPGDCPRPHKKLSVLFFTSQWGLCF